MEEEFYKTALMAGCAAYMAPELLLLGDDEDVHEVFTKASDIYAFAMNCFEVSHAGHLTYPC